MGSTECYNSLSIIRSIVLAVALINQIVTLFGANPLPFSDEQVYESVTAIFTAASSLWAWWENNSFTREAIAADEEYERLVAENKNSERGI